MPSPICLLDGYSTTNGFDSTTDTTITVKLQSRTGVNSWDLKCIGCSKGVTIEDLNAAISFDQTKYQYTITTSSTANAAIYKSSINKNIGLDGNYQNNYSTKFAIYLDAALNDGYRLIAINETTEGSIYGWANNFNKIVANGINVEAINGVDYVGYDITAASLSVTGSDTYTKFPTLNLGIKTVNASYAMTDNDCAALFIDSVNDCTITLPDPTSFYRIICIFDVNSDTGHTIESYDGEEIHGSTSPFSLTQHSGITLISNGTNWLLGHSLT